MRELKGDAVEFLRIGEVAKKAEVGIETIRYYERQGLLDRPKRRASGYRQFDESVVERLRFIRRAKDLGFQLSEIKEIMELWFESGSCCEHIRRRAENKVQEIESKIRSLQQMKRSLSKVVRECASSDDRERCPLTEGLDQQEMDAMTGT